MTGYAAKEKLIEEIGQNLTLYSVLTMEVKTELWKILAGYEVQTKETPEDAVNGSADLLEMFLNAKAVEGRTQKTIARYRYILNQFFKYEGVSAHDATVHNIRDYFMQEKKRGIADSTIAGYRDVFNSFFGWLFDEGLIKKNPCANVGAIKQEKKVRKPFTAVETNKLLQACKTKRDKAIVMFLLTTGCRVSELCGVTREDIDVERRECVVYGKGKKERTVYFDDVTAWIVKEYLDSRKDNHNCLFLSKTGEPLTAGGVRAMLHNLEDETGVENVHPHRFRRTLATSMINKGMPIQEVAAILGHDKIDTTMKYVYQSKERTKANYERYSV